MRSISIGSNHAGVQSRATRISARWLVAISVTIILAFCAVCGAVLWEIRRGDWDKASQASKNIVATIEADIARNIESYDLSLQAVIDGLKLPEINQVSPEIRQLVLFNRAVSAKHLGAIRVIDVTGNTIINSRNPRPHEANRSERDYFKAHVQNANAGLYVGRPFVGDNGQHLIGISRRLSSPDGSFAGVVVGSLKLSYFHDLFRRLKLDPKSAMGVARTDGIVLMRSPFNLDDIGRDISNNKAFKQAVDSHFGQFEETASIDGIQRFYTFRKVGDYPLLIMIGVSIDEIYAGWRQEAWRIGPLMFALCGATFALALFSAQELRRRAEAERALGVLATTDSLTGLSNRRHFDEVLEDEWQRSMRQKTAVAALMIDADWFKTYNDRHGHLAGDKALKVIADCILDSIRRATDFVARFGGEEFVVLLPDASVDVALAVAERIRKRVMDLGSMQRDCPEIPTVSIGVASKVPHADMQPCDLISAADLALYEAKHNGRNQTQPARPLPLTGAELKLVVNQ